MTSTVRQIEAAIIAVLKSALGDAAMVVGYRESVAQGEVKSSDGDGRPEVLVAVSPATSDNYASPVVSYDVAASVRLEWADDPTIAAFDETAAVVEFTLQRFNVRENLAAMSAALTTDNFRCDGFRLNGGADSIEAGDGRNVISTTFNFAVKGVFKDTTNESEA